MIVAVNDGVQYFTLPSCNLQHIAEVRSSRGFIDPTQTQATELHEISVANQKQLLKNVSKKGISPFESMQISRGNRSSRVAINCINIQNDELPVCDDLATGFYDERRQ